MTHGVFGLLRQPTDALKVDTRCWLLHIPQGVSGEQLHILAELKNGNWADYKMPIEALAEYTKQALKLNMRHERIDLLKDEAQELAERLNAVVPPHRLRT